MNYEREFNRMIVNKNRNESEFSPLRSHIKNHELYPHRLAQSPKPSLESSHLPYNEGYCSIYKSSYRNYHGSRSSDKYSKATASQVDSKGNAFKATELKIDRDPHFEIKAKERLPYSEFPTVGSHNRDEGLRYMQLRVRNEYIKNRMDGYGRDCISSPSKDYYYYSK